MKLFPTNTYISRRSALMAALGSGKLLFLGNNEAPMNYVDNCYRFRQDSNFLYFFGINLPNLVAIIDIDRNQITLFGNENTLDDIIWIGPQESLGSLAEKVGISVVKPLADLEQYCDINTQFTKPYRAEQVFQISKLCGQDATFSVPLSKAIIAQRSIKTEEELMQMHDAVDISKAMHLAAMKHTRNAKFEYEVVAEISKTLGQHNAQLAYPVILSTHGETLHIHDHSLPLKAGRLVLNDSGAENTMQYAGDITRTFPVDGVFSNQQKNIYEIVLNMEKTSIASLKEGVTYRQIHIKANEILINGLKALGILNGDTAEMLAMGVGGLFMPHGLGHMIGLDVHDMENIGEDMVGYDIGQKRCTQMGLKSLRLAKELKTGYALTVEPGCYFIPALISKTKEEFKNFVNYGELDKYLDFGGIRIEDNVSISTSGCNLIGSYIPKEIQEIEEIMKS